ncbi:MAG: RluA family pseudouridine synthase, partial [Comamonadaceae bacterium]|nr:RluA family pseudouridine synthase [Comamonadaceae bacterium]
PEPVYADDTLLVFNKPAGLLAVPGRGPDKADCLAARVQSRWPGALVVHRLDQATSGLVLMARHPHAQRLLGDAFARRHVHKRYEAVVAGAPRPCAVDADGWAAIDLPLAVDWPNRPRSHVDPVHGKPSLTHWRVAGPGPLAGTTRLLLAPVTGRSHQLRVHLLALGHPIVGDALYAPPAIQALAPRLLLHACALTLAHPVSGQTLHFESPAPFSSPPPAPGARAEGAASPFPGSAARHPAPLMP